MGKVLTQVVARGPPADVDAAPVPVGGHAEARGVESVDRVVLHGQPY